MKIFVQGDRDAAGVEKAAAAIAEVLAQLRVTMEILVNLGAYGELVKIFLYAGCQAVCHGHRQGDRGKCPEDVPFIDCCEGSETREKAWTKRLGLFLESDAFLFFSGREGTLAHLFPCLAFAKKHGKKVALVGWPIEKEAAILALTGIKEKPKWLGLFDRDAAPQEVVEFLVSE